MGCFLPSLVEIGPVVLKNFFFISLFRNYLPLEKGGALHLNKVESPSSKMICVKLVLIVPVVLKKISKICH